MKFDETIEDNDPYVCFRRREVKSTRKTRRCDQLSLDKLRKLHDEMIRAREILNLIVERERIRKEMILYDVEIFQTRIKVRAFKRILGIAPSLVDVDASPEKRKKRVMVPEPEKLKLPVQRFKDLFSPGLNEGASIEDKIKRRKLLDEREGWLDLTEVYLFNQGTICWNSCKLRGRILDKQDTSLF